MWQHGEKQHYLSRSGSEMASRSNMPSVMYFSLVTGEEQSLNLTLYPTCKRNMYVCKYVCMYVCVSHLLSEL